MNIAKTLALTLAIGFQSVIVGMEEVPSRSKLIVRAASEADRSTLITMIASAQETLIATEPGHDLAIMEAHRIADLYLSKDSYLVDLHGSVAQYKCLIACNKKQTVLGIMLYQIVNERTFCIPTGVSTNMSLVVIPSDVENHRRFTIIRNAFEAAMQNDVKKSKEE